jgi:2,3-bisphosphoglycerate-dependent phosphoglycerate mutase
MEATRIIALRHGETAWNLDARIQGHTDIALNDTGHWQAQRLAQALAQEPIAAIYASDLQRADATARAIATRCARPVTSHRGLRERHFGLFEGKTFTQIEAQWPDQAQAWRTRVPHWSPAGGESLLALRERIAHTVAALAGRHLGEQIVLVTHGGVLDMLYRIATGQALHTPRTWPLGNASINRLLWTAQGIALVGWSDTRHLDPVTLDERTP